MAEVSNHQREIARYVASAFSINKPPIRRFCDDDDRSEIFILSADDCPQHGVRSYSTVGLSEYPLILDWKDLGVRAELVGACGSAFPKFDNVMATLAFCVLNSKWFCAPGRIFPDVVSMHAASLTMSDIYFATPYLWDGKFSSSKIGDQTVAWLQAVPVSREESDFAQKFGPSKLEELFSDRDIDVYDLNRPSVV